MNTPQRQTLRRNLIDAGFDRNGYTDDIRGTGDYTENWTHADGSTVEVKWAPREASRGVDDMSGSINDVAGGQVAEQVGQVVSAPGMYEEPDTGLSLPIARSEEEDRIPSGVVSDAQAASLGVSRSEHPHPSVLASFEGMQTTFVVVTDENDPQDVTELTGYPVDAWRFSETALAVRVTRQHPTRPFTYGTDLTGTDVIVLPDDRAWSAQSPTHKTGLRHLPATGAVA